MIKQQKQKKKKDVGKRIIKGQISLWDQKHHGWMMLGNELLILIPDTKVFELIKTIYYQNSGLIDYKNQ